MPVDQGRDERVPLPCLPATGAVDKSVRWTRHGAVRSNLNALFTRIAHKKTI